MCAGAILQARIPTVVYGAADPKAGAVHTLYRLLDDPRLKPPRRGPLRRSRLTLRTDPHPLFSTTAAAGEKIAGVPLALPSADVPPIPPALAEPVALNKKKPAHYSPGGSTGGMGRLISGGGASSAGFSSSLWGRPMIECRGIGRRIDGRAER